MRAEEIWTKHNPILLTEVGSTVHGVTVADTDDIDAIGVFIEPKTSSLGLSTIDTVTWRTKPEGVPSGPDDEDLSLYSLRKYVRLAEAGNPSILLPLFVPQEKVYVETEAGKTLRGVRDMFITKQTGKRYLGYAKGQRECLLGIRAGKVNRARYQVGEEGERYDSKYAYHMLRLGYQGWEMIVEGGLTLPMEKSVRELLLRVRAGDFTLAEVLAMAEEREAALEHAIDKADLPDQPLREEVNGLLVRLHMNEYLRVSSL